MNSNFQKCPFCQKDLTLNPDTGDFECSTCPKANQSLKDQMETMHKKLLANDTGYKKALRIRVFYDDLNKATPKVFVSKVLLQLNIAIFILMVLQGVDIMNPGINAFFTWGSNYPPLTVNGEWWRLLSSMFLHGGLIHLAFNMYALKVIGPIVEKIFGNVGFLLIYLFSGLCGSLASVYSNVGSSVGASGAICGIFGALIGFMIFKRTSIPKEISSSILRNAAFIILLNAMIGLNISQIDNSAHLGGLLGGLGVASFMGLSLKSITEQRRKKKNITLLVAGTFFIMALAPYLASKVNSENSNRQIENRATNKEVNLKIAEFNKYENKLDRAFYADTKVLDMDNDLGRQSLLDKINQEILPVWNKKADNLLSYIKSASKNKSQKQLLYVKKYVRLKTDYFTYWQRYLKTKDDAHWRKAEKMTKAIDVLNREYEKEGGMSEPKSL